MSRNKIYLASPWFTKDQEEREQRIKSKLRDLGFEVHSPKECAVCDSIANSETRQRIFKGNTDAIEECDILFAITDGKDMGTIWESGYACGFNASNTTEAPIKIIYYCETLGNGLFNLMLAQSADIVITNFKELDMLPDLISGGAKIPYAGNIE